MTTPTMWNLDFLSHILLKSSQSALHMQDTITIHEKVMPNGYKETYTNADVYVEKFITDAFLNAQTNNLYVIGEESIAHNTEISSLPNMYAETTVVIDPIDGTRNFINELPNWCVSIGLIQNSEFIEGAIALPILGEVFISTGSNVYEAKMKSQLSQVQELQLHEFKMKQVHSEKHLTYSAKSKLLDSKHKHQVDRSCVYSIAKVLTSGYFAYIGKPKIWDLAACIGIFRRLNLPVYYYKKNEKEIHILPWKITEEHWKHYTDARYPIIFTDSYAHATELVATHHA